MASWFEITNAREVPSPALLVYPARIQVNIEAMLRIAPAARLRPHVKTHKMREVVALCLKNGIEKFKTATLAETEMTAQAGAPDILLAFQPVGPNIARLKHLVYSYPHVRFSTLVDNLPTARALSNAFLPETLQVWVDVDCGMHRTGINPGASVALYQSIQRLPGLRVRGLHAYDGHIHSPNLKQREKEYRSAMAPVFQARKELEKSSGIVELVAGGTPTFPFNARDPHVECSPGTPLLWDAGYAHEFPDLPFQIAATLLCRVISIPTPDHYCLDLGHKAIASESPQPRLYLPQVPDAQIVSHSEEHLVIRTGKKLKIGSVLYAFPKHICPTCALYDEAVVVSSRAAQGRWKIHRTRIVNS